MGILDEIEKLANEAEFCPDAFLIQIGDRITACPHFPEGTRAVCQVCKRQQLELHPPTTTTVTNIDHDNGVVTFDADVV